MRSGEKWAPRKYAQHFQRSMAMHFLTCASSAGWQNKTLVPAAVLKGRWAILSGSVPGSHKLVDTGGTKNANAQIVWQKACVLRK